MPSFSKPPFQAMVTICYENFNWIFSCQSPTLLYSRLHSTFHPIMVKSMIVGIYYYVDRLIFNRKVKHFYFFLEGGGVEVCKNSYCTLFQFIIADLPLVWYWILCQTLCTTCNRFERTNSLCAQCTQGSPFRGKFSKFCGFFFCKTPFHLFIKFIFFISFV